MTIIKIGGGLVGQLDAFWPAVKGLLAKGPVVMVHGGGPQATAMARKLGHEPTIVHGRRVTSDLDLDIVRWAMRGEINLGLSAEAHAAGIKAAGISGADGGVLRVHRRPPWTVDGHKVDFGWVGDVDGIETGLLTALTFEGYLPIVAPVGIDDSGQVYNVNADTVAAEIAKALGAEALIMVTEAGCLRTGPEADAARVSECGRQLFEEGTEAGWIQGGMRVKIQLGLEALEGGVGEVWITAAGDVQNREQATRIKP